MRVRVSAWIARAAAVSLVAMIGACTTGGSDPSSATSVAQASASTASTADAIPGCVPACGAGGRIDPVDLPGGEYRTDGFFGGAMSATFGAGWTSPEDSSGEFAAVPSDGTGGVLFWLDVYPVERFERVEGVPLTADAVVGWLRANPNLDVTEPVAGTIGELPATVVDVSLAADAKNEPIVLSRSVGQTAEDIAYCHQGGRVCAFFLGFPQWFPEPGVWGLGVRGEVQRMYFSDVTYGGRDHLFVAVVYANPPTAGQQAMFDRGQRILDTIRVPVTSA